jgi:hypothetical protein
MATTRHAEPQPWTNAPANGYLCCPPYSTPPTNAASRPRDACKPPGTPNPER